MVKPHVYPYILPLYTHFSATRGDSEYDLPKGWEKQRQKFAQTNIITKFPALVKVFPDPPWGAAQELHIWAQVSSKAAPCAQETQKHFITDRKIKLIILQSVDQVCAVFIKGLMSSSSSYAKPRWLIHRAFVWFHCNSLLGSSSLCSLSSAFCFLALAEWLIAKKLFTVMNT